MTWDDFEEVIRRISRIYSSICIDALPYQSVLAEFDDEIERDIGRVCEFIDRQNSAELILRIIEQLESICESAEKVSGVKAVTTHRSFISGSTLDATSSSSLHAACNEICERCDGIVNLLHEMRDRSE